MSASQLLIPTVHDGLISPWKIEYDWQYESKSGSTRKWYDLSGRSWEGYLREKRSQDTLDPSKQLLYPVRNRISEIRRSISDIEKKSISTPRRFMGQSQAIRLKKSTGFRYQRRHCIDRRVSDNPFLTGTVRNKKYLTFRTGFRSCQADILHELEGEGHVVDFLLGVVRCQVKVVQRNEKSFKRSQKKDQVNSVMELRIQITHFQVNSVQVFVRERN